jgi:bifunctional DNA-binding transcriptional regulator/antitoxin component of YhaV-PrlF toxin-antitoxin module
MTITCRVRKRITITGTKLDIELHRSLNSALIPKRNTSKKILDILFLGDRKTIRSGGNLNPKKVAKRTNISHKKLITKTGLNKGNILRIITSDDHIINIEKKKSASTRRNVNKQRRIMSTRGETSSSHHRGETLKPGTRGLF